MRSKNSVPLQIVLPGREMGNRQTVQKAAFEEALHSTIETNLRSSGVAPSHIFSSLYLRSFSTTNSSTSSSEPQLAESLAEKNGNETKPDISQLQKQQKEHSSEAQSISQELTSPRTSQDLRTGAGVSPFVPTPFVATSAGTASDTQHKESSSKWLQQQQQHTSTTTEHNPSQQQQIILKDARVEHFKQLHTWKLLQQQQQQLQKRMLPRNAGANTLLQAQMAAVARPDGPRPKANGIANRAQFPGTSAGAVLPTSPMFRKGYCKGGRDIRLSTLEKNSANILPYPSTFALVAMTISSVPINTAVGNDALVVAAVNLKFLPLYQQDTGHLQGAVFAQCVGCGDRTLGNFAMLASHTNLRLQTGVTTDVSELLRRHARYFVVRNPQQPHTLVKGAVIPWNWSLDGRQIPSTQAGGEQLHGSRLQNSLPMLVAPYMNMYMAHAAAAKQSGDAQSKNNVLYPNIVNKITQSASNQPIVVADEEDTSKISSLDIVAISNEFFSQFDFVPVVLNIVPNVTFDLRKSLTSDGKEIHVYNQLHEIFQSLSENCNETSTSTSSCKFQCFTFFLYLNSLGFHEPVSEHSYATFMRSVFDKHTHHLTNMLENVSPLNTLSLAQFLTQNMAKLHVSQVSFGHALQTFYNSSSGNRCDTGAKFHVIAHANDTSITGMCLVITDGFMSQLTLESWTTPVDLHTNVISNIKKMQATQFKDFWSLFERLFPHKQTLDSHNDDHLVIDTMVTDDYDKLSSRQHAYEMLQRNVQQRMIDDMRENFTEKVLDLICDDSSPFHLMHFTSIRCRFVMPSHHSSITQTEQAVNKHGLKNLYGEAKQMILTSNENHINILQEEINTNSTELFIIFSFLQSKDKNSTRSPRNSPLCNDIRDRLLQKNVLFIQCTDNQHFEPKKNYTAKCNLFVNLNKHTDYFGVLDHCATVGTATQHEQTLTHCEPHEATWRNIVARGLDVHSYDARTSLVIHEYTQAMYKVAKTQQSMTNIGTGIHGNSDSSFALNIILELVSCSHVSCVLRIPSMSVATLAYLQLRDVRDRLSMTKQFEIIIYNPSVRPSMSNQYLKLLQERRNEDSTWHPASLAECNCIPVLVIYAGDVCLHHQMPSSLHSIDLRLSWLNAHPSTTALGREMSLLSGFYRFPSSKRRVSSITDDIAESPPNKKRKESCEESNDGGAEKPDSTDQAVMSWKGMEEESPPKAMKSNGLKRSHDESASTNNPVTSTTSMDVDTSDILPRPPTAILPQSVFNTILNHVKKNSDESTIPEDKSPVLLLPSTDEAVVVEVAFPSRSGFVDACCGFATNLHSRWRELCQIEVYSNSCDVLPSYPISHEFNEQPNMSTLHEIPFTVVQPNNEHSTVVFGNMQSAPSSSPVASEAVIPGDHAAFNKMHRMCDKCLRNKLNTGAEIYSLSIPNVTPHLLPPDENKLIVELIIPKRHSDKFVFLNGEVSSIKFKSATEKCLKTPVLSFAVSGVEHGLFNLNHTLASSSGENTDVLHMLVVRSKDADSYRSSWPNMVLMILPEEFDDYTVGAMKYAAHKFFIHCYDVQSSATSDATDILWPFIMFMDDNCALWWKYSEALNWIQTSLCDVIERMESAPGVEQLSLMGVSPWRSNNRIVTDDNMTNRFSRCNLSSCFAINVNTIKDKPTWKYDMFLNEDLDFCLSVHNHNLLSLQFNDIAVATKVIKSRHVDNALDRSSCLVSTADSDFELIDCHPRLLLETYMSRDGTLVFNSSTPEHPIAVVDGYMSFGPNAFVEYVSSQSTYSFTNKLYGGLFLNSPTSEFPDDLLQRLQFIEGAAVCVVDKDRNSLRQTVVNLNLERRWHFRLTDEFQTTNKTNKHKPLFFLTGIFKN